MKKTIFPIFFCLLPLLLFAEPAVSLQPQDILKEYEVLEEYFPRQEGSPAEKKVVEYIEGVLKERRIDFEKFDFNSSDTVHSFSECLSVTLQGTKRDTLFFIIPLNHPRNSEKTKSGIINIVLGLSLIRQFSQTMPPVTIRFLFMGGEYGETDQYPLGSKLYLEDFSPDYPVFFLYLNLRTIPGRIAINGGGNGIVTPHWLINICSESLKKADIPFLIRGNKNQIFRMGFSQEKPPIEPYLKARFPAVILEGEHGELSPSKKAGWITGFITFAETMVEEYREGIPEAWDQHYLFFQLFDFYLIIREEWLVLSTIIIFGIFFIYLLVYSHKIKLILKHTFRYSYLFPLMIGLAWLFFLLATLVIHGILTLKNDPSLWKTYPFLFFLCKIMIVLLFFLISLKIIRLFPLPMNRSFFSTAAIMFLFLDIIILALINISFMYYFLWVFAFTLGAVLVRNKIVKSIMLLISPYWIVKFFIDFFILMPEPLLCRAVLLSLIEGNLFLSLFTLPFLCLIIYWILNFFPARHKKSVIKYNLATLLLAVSLTGVIGFFLLFPSYTDTNPQPVTARTILDFEHLTHRIEISSPSMLGEISVWDDKGFFSFNTTSNRYIIPRKNIPDLLSVTTTETSFLDRKNVEFTLRPKGNPYRVQLTIRSEKEFTLYDSNYPVQRKQKGLEYDILIGVNPPSPLPIFLTLPKGLSCRFFISIDYMNIPFRFIVLGKNKNIRTILTLTQQFDIET
ncbi:MAG: hypothetical protein JW881_04140 [Spirochaetales bacterium]|nr:hypothetical protein [Spirochaetales bacterium]